jgi:alkylation response protein AidB-like acyl-CoA dehydrogenase
MPGDAAEDLRRRWLPEVAAGRVALAVAEPGSPARVAAGAELILVHGDGRLHAIEAKDLELAPRRSIDGARHLLEVGALPHATSVLAGGTATTLWRAAADRGAWATAAVLVGAADRLVTMTAEYASARVQFGKPIGSFQAVKHHLAQARIRLEFARPLVYATAWALDEGEPDTARRVAMAKSAASDAASLAASVALQVHGAIGYTWQHDLHLWMKRAWSLSAAWGDAGWHRSRLLGAVDW